MNHGAAEQHDPGSAVPSAARARVRFVGAVAVLGSFLGMLAGCGQAPSMLVSVTADGQVEQYDLYIRDDVSQTVIFHSGFNPVLAPGEKGVDGTRDLTKEALKIAVKLSKGGDFTLLLVGVIGDTDGGKPASTATQFFWAGRVHVEGATHIDARLLTVPVGDDQDQDLWPDVSAFPQHVPEAAELYAKDLDLLDCDDKVDNPLASTGKVVMLLAANINPFAVEICGDGYDEDCNGNTDEACVDKDGDGDPRGNDCNDDDAARHHPTAMDPYPDPPNCCGYSLGKQGTPNAGVDYLHAAGDPACYAATCTADTMLCPKQRCGDGIDEACKGGATNDPANDTACVVDADCDGYPAPPQGGDCDDHNPNIHPGAVEICGDGINQSCNALGADAGCVPCDVDGDGYQRKDTAASCPTAAYVATGRALDCDDYDAGVYPGSTTAAGGSEGGINAMGRVATGLKGLCRAIYEPTGVTGTAKIAVSGFTIGDADCNGTAFQGCPPASCDADGDGWPANACGALALSGPFDCNDNDPTIFPGAPDKCGDGVDGSCSGADTACNGMDKDGDGYLPPADCDDTNPAIHPFAVELCNGKDDDCDGDTDEGNPDPSGVPLITTGTISSCSDSNIGLCAMPLGLCACSPTIPVAYTDPAGKRTFCSGETMTSARLPHCFGAGQPTPQTCDGTKVDNDCDGSYNFPAPNPTYSSSQSLAIMGKTCGINVGKCMAGTAKGCNQDVPQTYFGNQATAADEYWVCGGAVAPLPAELCNGFDDTCVGSLALNEQDVDMDGYLACTPCSPPLAGALKGCGDCNDADATVYPGAAELCDDKDNNCNGTIDEAPNECSLANNGTTCCSTEKTCRNLSNSVTDCGSCGMTCTLRSQPNAGQPANACAGGACVCGNTGSACGSGQYCNGNSCATCNTSTFCGANCTPCGTNQVCKSDGSSCTGCNTDSDCGATTYCSGGNCVPRNPQGGSCTPNAASPNTINDNCLQTSGALYCTDNVCCNQPPLMCGGCMQCNKGGSVGSCSNVSSGNDPHNACTLDVATCELDACNGGGSCAASDGTACGMITCVDNATESHTQDQQCEGGSCGAGQSELASCGQYKCNGNACFTSCTADSQCQSGNPFCYPVALGGDGKCYAHHTPTESCSQDSDCMGACIGGVCCGNNGRPSSCGSGTNTNTSCAGSTLTMYMCNSAMQDKVCSSTPSACPNDLTCANGTSCNNDCTCATAPCTNTTQCDPGFYCPSNGSTSCNACTTDAFCGPTCTTCALTCNAGVLSGGCKGGATCTGTNEDCPGNFACATGSTCKTNCASDADCETGSSTKYWCKAGAGGMNSCAPEIASGGACNAANCAMSPCNECTSSGGSACPGGSGSTCP